MTSPAGEPHNIRGGPLTPERLHQIEELYHSAREREPGERAEFLARACQNDDELRQELDQLLASELSSGNILDKPAVDLLASSIVRPLSVGTKLGPYEILALIGKGGMGEVYRARDPRLNRDVAIKVLPTALARDPERLARFEREAKVLASLNHPNIAQIHAIEEVDGVRALVMELVPGQTLTGPIPLDEALRVAAQVADALGAAHEKGITHRDLKPLNVMITPEGVVKVLDFGLAAVAQPSGTQQGDLSQSPTVTISPTRAGMILGTAAYMSPEQARGQSVDRRSDIWSFGVLLYEMGTGKQLFHGNTVSDILASVLKDEPNLEQVPAKVRPLLRGCLEKEPKKRLQAIGDWELLLNAGEKSVAPERTNRASPVPWITAAVLAISLIGVSWVAWRATRPIEQPLKPLVRLDVDLGSDVRLDDDRGTSALLSPDGTRLVYLSRQRLFTRRLDQPKAAELAGTEGAIAPFFSPDGQSIAFFAQGKLKTISVDGGAAVVLCDAGVGNVSGSWGEDGNIITVLSSGSLSRVPSAGGAPTRLTELAPGELIQRFPQILPGKKAVLFTSFSASSADAASISVVSLADGKRKMLQQGGTYGRYVASHGREGHLLYVNRGTLFAVPFDPESLAVRGTPAPVLEQVYYSQSTGRTQFDVSQQGTLVYRSGSVGGIGLTIQWMDSAGKMQPLLAKPDAYQSARLSPDGQRLAISTTDLWVYELQRDTMTRLTFGDSLGSNSSPAVWSPDGRYIIFRDPREGLFWIRSDGASQPKLLVRAQAKNVNSILAYSFTPDGKRLAFREIGAKTGMDLWTVAVESDGAGLRAGKPEMYMATQFQETNPAFSPDGRWIAYDSNESGTNQIFVRAFPGASSGSGGKWQISDSGGVYPEWSRNGREVFFRTPDNRIAVASYAVTGDSFVADKPRLWSAKSITQAFNGGLNYNPAPDGKRLVVFAPVQAPEAQQAQNHVIFLENFFDELRRKVPAK